MALHCVVIRLAAITLSVTACFTAPHAGASVDDLALNGTFRATSNGDWAQTNDSYHDEQTVRSIWTITSACSTALDCSGTVTSDQGWTAPISKTSQSWTVERQIANWEPCVDGTGGTGRQVYRFFAVDESGAYDLNSQPSSVYAGVDKTTGPSGACGINRILAISMPFRLEKLA
jgi:hypothetical protein